MNFFKIAIAAACFSAANVSAQGLDLAGNLGELLNPSVLLGLINDLSSSSFPVVSGITSGNGDSLSALAAIGGATLLEPQILISTLSGLGLPLVGDYSPALGVLIDNPANILDYLLTGDGVLLGNGIAVLPEIPIISAPLNGL